MVHNIGITFIWRQEDVLKGEKSKENFHVGELTRDSLGLEK